MSSLQEPFKISNTQSSLYENELKGITEVGSSRAEKRQKISPEGTPDRLRWRSHSIPENLATLESMKIFQDTELPEDFRDFGSDLRATSSEYGSVLESGHSRTMKSGIQPLVETFLSFESGEHDTSIWEFLFDSVTSPIGNGPNSVEDQHIGGQWQK
ncbi:hypothetical protein PGT21_009254 [Puccinia graminis f. sp. tritici]|uniref:Uncharacterized protein n=1 Tax=Puccinia graminis f. sp. tritici TaxID=56615 RepID=A0A5B0MR04_PUCGR|nr:hypothetical protein PGT21_009254 [Puccinia graminis f. sp. tritici]